jgi:hypothetical protein
MMRKEKNKPKPRDGVCVWVVPYTLMMANPLHLLLSRRIITMFNKLTDKQCAMLLAVLVGIFGLPALLLALNIVEWLLGEALMGFASFVTLGYVTWRILQEINPDNDDQEEEEYFS